MTPLQPYITRLTFCGKVGALAGPMTAALYSYVQARYALSWSESLLIALVSSVATWLFLLLIVGVWLRYGVRCVALLVLFSSAFAAFGVVVVLHLVPLPRISLLVGLVVGLVFGELVCRLCRLFSRWSTVDVPMPR